MFDYDPDAQRFRDYAEGHSNDSPVDLSGREGAPRESDDERRERQTQESYDYRNEQEAERFDDDPYSLIGTGVVKGAEPEARFEGLQLPTPRPWEWSTGDPDGRIPRIYQIDEGAIADVLGDTPVQRRQRAALIVQAVNSYAALVAHLLATNEVLGRCAAQFEMLRRPALADECMAQAKANRAALKLAGK